MAGLDPGKRVDQYLVNQWGMNDGLLSNQILSITQTNDGYLWIRTDKSLIRFDGAEFTNIPFVDKQQGNSLQTAAPGALYVDRKGTLWIGSASGLTSCQYQTRRFNTRTTADGITGDNIRHIKEDSSGNLWVSFVSGYVDRFSNGRFKSFGLSDGLEGKIINAIVEDQKGNLLFGSADKGVFIFKDEKFSPYPVPGLENLRINTMYTDHSGDLWIGSSNGLFRKTGNRIQKYTTLDGLSHNYITSILEDSKQVPWIGTSKGLNRIKNKQTGSIVFEPLLESVDILSLFEDSEGNLWAGTDDSGLIRLKDPTFFSYPALDMYPDETLGAVFEDRQGDVWVGTFSGKLFQCRGNNLVKLIEPPGLTGRGITAIAGDAQGNLWLGTNGKGVFQYKEGRFVQFTTAHGLIDNHVTSITKDSQANLWFGTYDGVSVRHPNGNFESLDSQTGLSGKWVYNVYEDKNRNIRIAADKGITVLEGGQITGKNKAHHLKDISVTCIYEDPSAPPSEGNVFWVATYGKGLKRLVLKDRAVNRVTSYTKADGMPTDLIYQFIEDQRGYFWLTSDSGILRVNKTTLDRFSISGTDEIDCISFGEADGMESTEFNNRFSRHSALKTRNGELLFVTKKGISVVNPTPVPDTETPLRLMMEDVLFDLESVLMHPGTQGNTFQGITTYNFYFTAPTFRSPEKIKFKYRLEGFEEKWVLLPPGNERAAYYKDLAPGNYTFKVIACSAEGVWNEPGVSFTFTLKPPWYRMPIIIASLLFLLAVLFYIYKKRSSLKGKHEKYKTSNLNPDFVEECIKKINYRMEVEKDYRDETISLQSLAEKLSIHPHQLSQILNETLDRNFFDFINYHRIEEAKRILASPGKSQYKITSLSYDVGFNTPTVFYKAFKKYTGMTPRQYKKETRKKK
ncbi:MAG: helix-turn-helix domain-containing protein [bacterium]|nr:helix-turn-helix domain-containing protein [bacterium]